MVGKEDLLLLEEQLPQLINELERKVPYASVLLEHKTGVQVRVDAKQQSIEPAEPLKGAVIALFDGTQFHEVSVDSWDIDIIRKKAHKVLGNLTVFESDADIDPGKPCNKHFGLDFNDCAGNMDLAQKLELCAREQRLLKEADDRIINSVASYREIQEYKLFVNRSKNMGQGIRRIVQSTMAMASNGKNTQYAFHSKGGQSPESVVFDDKDRDKIVSTSLELLDAERIEPGFYDVIADPATAGIIAHEAFGHGVELDMFLKNRARSKQYLDKVVGSKLVNMLDDPTIPGAYASFYMDDEGQEASRTVIIDEGVFRQGLSDLYAATYLNTARTANGRRQDYTRKAYPRMTNTFFAAGKDTLEDMVASMDYGVYLEMPISGMEDPQGWGIQVLLQVGREVKDGKFTGRIFNPVGITGYVPDLLKSVTMVGRSVNLSPGFCGKGHKEMVPVTSGGPHIKMKARLG